MKKLFIFFGFILSQFTYSAESTLLNLPYTQATDRLQQTLDLYFPAAQVSPPLLVFIHGGAWISGDKSHFEFLKQTLLPMGFALASVNYRLSFPGGPSYPVHPEDVLAALRWLVQNKKNYPYDSHRIFVGGHSAGAHIAGWIASDPRSQGWVKGYLGFAGVYDVEQFARVKGHEDQYQSQFIIPAFGKDPKVWREASPVRRKFKKAAPWLIVHSEDDELVPFSQAQEFADHLKKQGVPTETLWLQKMSHSDTVGVLSLKNHPTTQKVLSWLKKIR